MISPIAFIMIGLPGAGKTTWLKDYAHEVDVICSADHFFEDQGVYKFDPRRLGEAHAHCLQKFIEACRDGVNVAVDNTNVQLIHIAPYMAIAQAYGYEVKVVHVESIGAQLRQKHGVPAAIWIRMRKELDETLSHWPRHWPLPKRIST